MTTGHTDKEFHDYWCKGMNELKLLIDTLEAVKKRLQRDYDDGNFPVPEISKRIRLGLLSDAYVEVLR